MPDQFFTKHPSVQYVRLQWVDYSGILHARVVPKSRCYNIWQGGTKQYLAQNCLIVPISISPECNPDGPQRWELAPDWDSLRPCGFAEQHATVMCYLNHLIPKQEFARAKCPRYLLDNVLDMYEGGPRILIGFEVEFVLLDKDLNLNVPLDRPTGYSPMSGLRGDRLTLLEDVCRALEKSQIQIHDFHSEVDLQIEITLTPDEPKQAIDKLLHTQETIRSIAVTHGLKASMTPRPILNGPQNGSHMHLSLYPLPDTADSFIAGILGNIKALCAFGMPNYDSYVRVTDDGAGCFIGWGTENRDLPIRKVAANRWEFRFCDATANLYLFVACLLSAGLDGMKRELELTWKDCMIFQENLDPIRLAEHGMSEKMPKNLETTVAAAKLNESVKKWVGEPLFNQYIKVKEKELEKFSKLTDDERRRRFLSFF